MSPAGAVMRAVGEPTVVAADWRVCTAITRAHGQTFFFATGLLPPAQRRAVRATYAYCRIADDIADQTAGHPRDVEAATRRLDAWETQLWRPRHPVAVAFAAARRQYGIPEPAIRELLAGVRLDLAPHQFADWPELREYCYQVAGTVGLMVAPILGCRDDSALAHAVDLGIAMQLTNILRDIGEDAGQGRLYLPLADLARFGCSPDAILRGTPDGDFAGLLAFEITRARALYASSRQGLPALAPAGRLTALAGAELYAGILHRIEAAGYDVISRRARVSTGRKLAAVPGIVASCVALSVGARVSPR